MPISPLVLQRRHAELGRIRLGSKKPITRRDGSTGTAPVKLEHFRFTSASYRYISDIADLYGGEPVPWDNNGKPEYEVFTQAQSIPVVVVKAGLSQWMETWSGGGCIHRCDGVTNFLTGDPCDLTEMVTIGRDRVNPHAVAKPTTRLSMMLPELDAIGVWRLESHGWNAAAEIPAVAELAAYVGDLVPAHLHLMERRAIKDGKTSRFVVPVLDLAIGRARLAEIVETVMKGDPALPGGSGTRLAIEAAADGPETPDYATLAANATTIDALRELWFDAEKSPAWGPDMRALFITRANELTPDTDSDDEPIDATLIDDTEPTTTLDTDTEWQAILRHTGTIGWTLQATAEAFTEYTGGVIPDEATADELHLFLTHLQEQRATA